MPEFDFLRAGFRSVPLSISPDVTPPDVVMAKRILMTSQFESWDEFNNLATGAHTELSQYLLRNGCHPAKSRSDRCRGDFRYWYCWDIGCFFMTKYKKNMHGLHTERICLNHEVHSTLLKSLSYLATKLNPAWKGITKSKPDLVNTQIACPDVAITQPGQQNPDVIINIKTPSTDPLLPHLRRRTALASVYAYKRVTEQSELSYDLLCLAEAIRSALFTRSGCSCLFSHNQGLFVKVIPNPIGTKVRTKITHKVLVSREFTCHEYISVFHGLLAFLVHGYEVSSVTREIKLRHYFRLLEASEHSRRGEWIVGRIQDEKKGRKSMDWVYGGTPRSLRYPEAEEKFKVYGDNSTTANREEWLDLYPEASSEAFSVVRESIWENRLGTMTDTDVTRMFITRSRFVEICDSGVFFELELHYKKVAVKLWNRKSNRGLARCLKEILVYKWIASNERDMLSAVVPQVAGIRENPPGECVLVTEYVGKDLYWFNPPGLAQGRRRSVGGKQEKVHWFVDGVRLKEDDISEIERSATKGLQRLKQIGIIHRNPTPKNLRVHKIQAFWPFVEAKWSTWWVGLGQVAFLNEKKFGDLTYIRSLHREYEVSENPDYWRNYQPVFKLRPPLCQE